LKRSDIKVRLGEWNTQSTNEVFLHKDFSAEKVTIHQKFNNKSLHNDIAIIKLSKEVKFEPHIRPVCLPKPNQSFTNQWCVTTGWGKNAFEGGQYANILKEVTVPVVDSDICQEALRKTKLGHNFVLHSGFLCAGGQEGRDSCKGDGGGPLVCQQNDGSYTLAGLVSWGIDCGEPGVPAVYCNVEKFMPFISQKTGIPLNE
jgi:secreted trypsin-like serine protease